MLPEFILDSIAVNVVEIWLLQRGILPSGGWDPNDKNCVRNDGPHRIWTIQGKIPVEQEKTLNIEILEREFREYLDKHNVALQTSRKNFADKIQN